MKTKDAKSLLDRLCELEVPLTLSVPFLIRARGWRVQAVTVEAGCHRTLLQMSLDGRRTPSKQLRECVRRVIGADPWEVLARTDRSVYVINRERN